jgi:polysaccharide biosynthesis protein PslG
MIDSEPLKNAGNGFRLAVALTMLSTLVAISGCGVQASSGTVPSPSASAAASSTTVPAGYFGMIIHDPSSAPSIHYGSQRLSDIGVAWSSLEPQRGVFDFANLDAEVAAAQSRRTDILLTLGQPPAWASSSPGLNSNYGAGASAPPTNIGDWDVYVTAVVTRYKGRIAAYELWNQPDSTGYWSGSTQQMIELSAHAFTTIKAIDPLAIVISPSGDQAWLNQFLAAGGGSASDVIGSHLSPSPDAPEAQASIANSLRSAMATYGASAKPVWNTENGWTVSADFMSDRKAAYVARSLILNWSNGISRVYWSSLDGQTGDSLPLVDDSSQPTEAATAYQQVESWLLGSTLNGCSANSTSTWTCQLNQNGKTAWILWNPNATIASSSLDAKTLTDLSGNQQDLTGISSISIGPKPVLLQ